MLFNIIRSQRCVWGVIPDEPTLVCAVGDRLHNSTIERQSSNMQTTFHPNTPLSRLSNKDLTKEVRVCGDSLREIQAQIQSLNNGT